MKKTIQFFLSCCLVLLFSAAQADQLRIEYKYDPLGNVVEEKHLTAGGAEINRITHSYDGLGRLKKSSDQLGVLREIVAYDAQGNVKHEKDGAGRSSYFEYDGLGRVEKISDDEGTIRTILEYDGKGNVLREKDGKGTESTHEYDHRGHLIKTTKAGITQEWKYDKNGNLEWETDGEGRKTRYEYDGLNRIKVVTDPAGNKQKTDYSVGSSQSKTVEVATTTDAENRVTIRKSDGRGRVLESIVVGEHGDEITFSKYNEANLLIQQTLPEGNEISYGYNARNLLTSASSNGSSATLGYDVAGNLKSRTDGGGNVTVYQYDARNRRTYVIYADGVKETAQYDLGDLLKQMVDANGVQTDISYDSRGREEKRTLSRGGAIKQTIEIAGYDANNNITQRSHNVAGKTYNESAQYDAHNRAITRTDSNGETFNFSYTKDHQQKSVTSKAGTSQYSYNTVGLLKDIDGSVSYTYYNNGLTDTITYADGSTTKHVYDESNRLKSIETKRGGTLIESAEYGYDKNGNRDYEKTVQGGKTVVTDGFTYDNGDRLTHFTETTTINGTSAVKTTAYAYDGAGNRTSETVSGSENYSKSYTPNKRNQIKQISENGSTTNFYYDKAGNLRQKKNETANRMFHWNESGDLIQVAEKTGETFRSIADYAYNADGLRIQKTNRQFQRNTSWLGNQALLDLDANKNLEASYEFGPNGRTAVLRKDADGTTEQLYADGMGSISATSSDTGTSYTSYDPFGNAEKSGAPSKNKFGFTGHESDDETGLVYAKARYYDPQLGRFISRDAFEGHGNLPASWNAYQYAYNNPFVWVDPDGNRSRTQEEDDWLATLSTQSGIELSRLQGASCLLIKCNAEYSMRSDEYKVNSQIMQVAQGDQEAIDFLNQNLVEHTTIILPAFYEDNIGRLKVDYRPESERTKQITRNHFRYSNGYAIIDGEKSTKTLLTEEIHNKLGVRINVDLFQNLKLIGGSLLAAKSYSVVEPNRLGANQKKPTADTLLSRKLQEEIKHQNAQKKVKELTLAKQADNVSPSRLNHASVGEYTTTNRLKGGGHGQDAIEYMQKNGIQFNITHTFPNGVRVGNVPNHTTRTKKTGNGQSWFPERWSQNQIKNAGNYVNNLPEHAGKKGFLFGEYNGVRVGIVRDEKGLVQTIFPDNSKQP